MLIISIRKISCFNFQWTTKELEKKLLKSAVIDLFHVPGEGHQKSIGEVRAISMPEKREIPFPTSSSIFFFFFALRKINEISDGLTQKSLLKM